MVTYTSGSPKRHGNGQRTGEAQRTAQQVAETNASLRVFTNRRQSSWMRDLGRTSNEEGATDTVGSNAGGSYSPGGSYSSGGRETSRQTDNQRENMRTRQFPRERTRRAWAPEDIHSSNAPDLRLDTVAGQASDMGTALVDYESPYTARVPMPLTTATALHSGPSSAIESRQSLPLPAHIDEHANSPGNQIAALDDSNANPAGPPEAPLKRPRGRPRKHPEGGSTSHARTPIASTRVSTDPTSRLAPTPLRTNSVAHTMGAALPPQQNMQLMSPRNQGVYDLGRMQQLIHDFFSPDQVVNPIDEGRKTLVLEAVKQEDYFYLALSQVFCLYTFARLFLPKQLQNVPAKSWSALERLLCSNQALTPAVAKFFVYFPASVQMIQASSEASFFLNQLVVIQNFLTELPQRWDSMIAISRSRMAPPLTQDMVEQLYLISPVLQNTAFRAIARALWRDETAESRFLESLHSIDQHTYTYQLWRRTASEKSAAYSVYANVCRAWKSHITQSAGRQSTFVPPEGCTQFFQQPPPSMGPTSGVNNPQRQYSRGAAQQLQLMEVNHRILAQQPQAGPGLTPAQQRQILQSNNHVIAQRQGLEPGPLNSLQYQPNQSVQQLTTYQQLPHILPSNDFSAANSHAGPHVMSHAAQGVAFASPLPQLPRLMPPENALPKPFPVQPDTDRVSLHQAYLRSPLPGHSQLPSAMQSLYRHVNGYVLSLTRLNQGSCAQTLSVSLSQAHFDKIPCIMPGLLPGEPGIRVLKEDSILCHLRCSKVPPGGTFDTESSWVTADNIWPEDLSFELNGKFLEARRKLHFGRYLPIDVSPYLRQGDNTLNVYSLPNKRDSTVYAVAIETIAVISHESIIASTPTISSAESLAAIKRSLTGHADDDDDDIAMTSSNLTIPLFDPFRADRICESPVRGAMCLHRECFDLETFLLQCRREQPGFPCVPDCWRCPICKGDVRPQTLVKDGFLMQVRQELEAKGLLDTRAIIVEADGSWRARVEAQATGIRSASLEREEAAAAAAIAKPASGFGKGKQKVVEVIELD